VGVTVLTSHTAESYAAALGRAQVALPDEVARLATDALRAGLRGVVCSPLEAATIRRLAGPGTWIVVPGIRRPGDPPGDHARSATPGEAARAGASHLVVGRPILQAAKPAEVFRELTEDAS
jgi:orotidine-5'-phosphate decarboxylase